jgi:hypothetical protein
VKGRGGIVILYGMARSSSLVGRRLPGLAEENADQVPFFVWEGLFL